MGIAFSPGPLWSLTQDPTYGLQIAASLHRLEEAVARNPEFEWLLTPSGQRVLLLFGDVHTMLGVGGIASVIPYLEGGEEEFNALLSLDVAYHVFESFEADTPVDQVNAWWGTYIETPLWDAAKLRNFADRLQGQLNPRAWSPQRGVMRGYALYAHDRQNDETMVANIVNREDLEAFKLIVGIGDACAFLIKRIENYLAVST